MRDVVFMGTPDFAVPSLEALLGAGYNVKAVFTQPDKPRGRSGQPAFSPVKECAAAHGIPVYQPQKIREPGNLEILRELAPEVIVVAAFGQIIPAPILELPRYGCLNVHASLLPKYRGAAPIQWAVIDGEAESGVTIMQMGEGLDTGDMLLKCVRPLAPDETGGSLFDKLKEDGAQLLLQALEGLEKGELTPEKQPAKSPTAYASMLTKQMGLIDWSRSAAQIERLIRGLDPWPSAYTYLGKKQLKLWRAQVVPNVEYLGDETGEVGLKTGGLHDRDVNVNCAEVRGSKADTTQEEAASAACLPGTILRVEKDSFSVQTGDGVLQIRELQLEGKKRMSAEAFLRGYALREGEKLSASR